MKKLNKLGIALILVVFTLLLVKDAIALGISPGRKVIDFEPKLRKEVTLTLFNTEHRDFRAVVLTRGELSKYIQLSQNSIEFSADEAEKSLSYEIFLPERFEKPGAHSGEVIIRELPSGEEGKEIVVDALVAVVSEIQVKVPFPGKYAEANFNIVGAGENKDAKFFLQVANLGEVDIKSAKAFIYIYDINNNLISIVKSEEKSINTRERKELVANWKANVSLGDYRATAILDYDGVILNLESSFLVGDFFVKPLDISIKNFKLGSVAKFTVLVENVANREIKDVTAQLLLFDENENKVMDIKSAPTEIDASSKKELIAYWDTENVKEGTYAGKIIFGYEGKSSERQIRTVVKENEIKTEIIGITAFAVDIPEAESEPNKGLVITIIIIVLVLSNIAWLIYFKKFRKK